MAGQVSGRCDGRLTGCVTGQVLMLVPLSVCTRRPARDKSKFGVILRQAAVSERKDSQEGASGTWKLKSGY